MRVYNDEGKLVEVVVELIETEDNKEEETMTVVRIIRRKRGTYRIQVGEIIWYDNLSKEEAFEAMENTTIDLSNDCIEHVFKFEM